MSPYLMNTKIKTYWTTKRPDWDTLKEGQTDDDYKVKANCTTYSGYIWNREPAEVNWTFACNVANLTVLHLDGAEIFRHSTGSTKPHTNVTVKVAPGAHRIRIGNYSKYYKNTTTGNVDDNTEGGVKGDGLKGMGLTWDRLGRGTDEPENFEILEDPGDGSLFTWALPGEEVFYPGTDESIKLGKFQRVKFSGGTLYLNNVTNRISEMEGMPLVDGSGKLIIESKWTIDAAEIADAEAAPEVAFGFGEDVELEIENPLVGKSVPGMREWTVIESAEDITGTISIKDEVAAKRWKMEIDGNKLKLEYRPIGTVMTVR